MRAPSWPILLAVTLTLSAEALVASVLETGSTGLSLRVRGSEGVVLLSRAHADVDAFFIDALLARAREPARAEFAGYVSVPAQGFTGLVVKSDGIATISANGVVLAVTGARETPGSATKPRGLSQGAHRVVIEYEPDLSQTSHELFIKGVTAEGTAIPLVRDVLSPSPKTPSARALAVLSRVLSFLAAAAWLGCSIAAIKDRDSPQVRRAVPIALLSLITFAGAAMRFESLAIRYWAVDGPAWAIGIANRIRDLRPGDFEHVPNPRPYEGDPFSYLTIARSMGWFYEPSVREPLFPWLASKAILLARDQDIGLNFVSAIASSLIAVAIYALGTRLQSRAAGLMAAALFAAEWQAISLSVEGWRDDLFTLFVTAYAAMLLATFSNPSRRNALTTGLMGGFACLTRLSSFTFIVPSLVLTVAAPGGSSRRDRRAAIALAAAVIAALVGPFMISCAFAYGDPFYAVNAHAKFYSVRSGAPQAASSVASLLRGIPFWEFAETGFIGLTSDPFDKKWFGLEAVSQSLATSARFASLLGIAILLTRVRGLLALAIMLAAIAPYAWTWNIPGGGEWRFTLPAYPFYLAAAGVAVDVLCRAAMRLRTESGPAGVLRRALPVASVALGLIIGWSVLRPWLAWKRVDEAVQSGRAARVDAEPASVHVFVSGWEQVANGDATALRMIGGMARLKLPPSNDTLRLVFRIFTPSSADAIQVVANDAVVGRLEPSNDDGSLRTVDIPANGSSSTGSDIVLTMPQDADDGLPFEVSWLRIEPQK